MKKSKIISLTLFILLISSLFLLLFKQETAVQTTSEIKEACFKQRCFSVESAKTAVERERGLMFRENLDKNNGMLFIFPKEDKWNFWMKNTLIPLDIIWIDSNNKIVEIKENALPCKENLCQIYSPKTKAKYVLELNSGITKENNIKIGDEVDLIN